MMRLRHNILQGGVRPASLEVDLPVAQSRPILSGGEIVVRKQSSRVRPLERHMRSEHISLYRIGRVRFDTKPMLS